MYTYFYRFTKRLKYYFVTQIHMQRNVSITIFILANLSVKQ